MARADERAGSKLIDRDGNGEVSRMVGGGG